MPESVTAAVTVEHDFAASPDAVWVALSDPVSARDALPCCDALAPADGRTLPSGSLSRLLASDEEARDARVVAEGEEYDATLTASVRGVETTLAGTLTVTEHDYPRMALEGIVRGDAADARMAAALTVEEAGTDERCHVTWTARADVEGALATYGRRPVESAAARSANAFFDALDAHLAAVAGPESERAVKDPDWRP
ncbi:CoxG family protein [Halarchaeum sp. P4]|uniref:CoxG family protein n=1 Tax=Halarchaeum sp. P4 TaxID=3421639 RepID=UPI003EC15587